MNIKKISGSLAVAVSMLALNNVASASVDEPQSCDDVKAAIMMLHDYVACDADRNLDGDRTWKGMQPIWQFGQSKKDTTLDGCSVHEKVNKLLYEERDAADGTEPPWKGKNNGKNGPKGAYHALVDDKSSYAYELLGQLVSTLDSDAKVADKKMQVFETAIRDRAEDLQIDYVLQLCP